MFARIGCRKPHHQQPNQCDLKHNDVDVKDTITPKYIRPSSLSSSSTTTRNTSSSTTTIGTSNIRSSSTVNNNNNNNSNNTMTAKIQVPSPTISHRGGNGVYGGRRRNSMTSITGMTTTSTPFSNIQQPIKVVSPFHQKAERSQQQRHHDDAAVARYHQQVSSLLSFDNAFGNGLVHTSTLPNKNSSNNKNNTKPTRSELGSGERCNNLRRPNKEKALPLHTIMKTNPNIQQVNELVAKLQDEYDESRISSSDDDESNSSSSRVLFLPEELVDKEGRTPLHLASFYNCHITVIQRLLIRNKSVQTRDKHDRYPLHYACLVYVSLLHAHQPSDPDQHDGKDMLETADNHRGDHDQRSCQPQLRRSSCGEPLATTTPGTTTKSTVATTTPSAQFVASEHNLLEIISTLLWAYPKAVNHKDKYGTTPYDIVRRSLGCTDGTISSLHEKKLQNRPYMVRIQQILDEKSQKYAKKKSHKKQSQDEQEEKQNTKNTEKKDSSNFVDETQCGNNDGDNSPIVTNIRSISPNELQQSLLVEQPNACVNEVSTAIKTESRYDDSDTSIDLPAVAASDEVTATPTQTISPDVSTSLCDNDTEDRDDAKCHKSKKSNFNLALIANALDDIMNQCQQTSRPGIGENRLLKDAVKEEKYVVVFENKGNNMLKQLRDSKELMDQRERPPPSPKKEIKNDNEKQPVVLERQTSASTLDTDELTRSYNSHSGCYTGSDSSGNTNSDSINSPIVQNPISANTHPNATTRETTTSILPRPLSAHHETNREDFETIMDVIHQKVIVPLSNHEKSTNAKEKVDDVKESNHDHSELDTKQTKSNQEQHTDEPYQSILLTTNDVETRSRDPNSRLDVSVNRNPSGVMSNKNNKKNRNDPFNDLNHTMHSPNSGISRKDQVYIKKLPSTNDIHRCHQMNMLCEKDCFDDYNNDCYQNTKDEMDQVLPIIVIKKSNQFMRHEKKKQEGMIGDIEQLDDNNIINNAYEQANTNVVVDDDDCSSIGLMSANMNYFLKLTRKERQRLRREAVYLDKNKELEEEEDDDEEYHHQNSSFPDYERMEL